MSVISHSLLGAVSPAYAAQESLAPGWVPIEGEAAYQALVETAFGLLSGHADEGCVLFIDGATAPLLSPEITGGVGPARVCVFGHDLPTWCEGLDAHACPPVEPVQAADRFCIVASGHGHAAVAAREQGGALRGVWSTLPDCVRSLAVLLVATMPDAPAWPEPPHDAEPGTEALALAMARVQAEVPANASEPAGHDDLYSVLEILKAISAERRSSDILYVFTEGVAKVVPMERCSVVRVWSDQRRGQVLASHEDERVQDLTIDLGLYPEIREVIKSGRKTVINNALEAPLMRPVRDQLEAAGITSIVVVPIITDDPEVGTLMLRAARRGRSFAAQEIGFFEIVTQAASNALERANLLENLQLANEHLERLAITDGLTGLHNHRYFIERLEEEVQRAKRYETPLACIFVDIDNFKEFNDTYGHLMGDAVLRETAQRIAQVMRRVDTVARYGGEELTIILPQTDEAGAASKGEMIRSLVAGTPFASGGGSVTVTVSIGVAVYCPETMEDHLALCRAADRALYISKRNGKNRVTVGGSHS